MVRQYAGYCGAAVVLSGVCLCLLSHSAWLLVLWAVALLTVAAAAANFSALFITAVMNEDFSCCGPKTLQYCCSSLFKKLMSSFTKFINARVGVGSKAGPVTPLCTAAFEAKSSSPLQITRTSAEHLPLADDGLIHSELVDLSQRLHDQFVLPWYLCLSPDGLSHHQLCGVLEDVLLSCWQQLRVAGGLRSLLLDFCDLFSVLALANRPLRHPSHCQEAPIGEVGPREYDQLSTLSQLVVLRHLPPLLLSCKGLVFLLRDLLTCNFVVPLYLKLCQPCLILQHWAAVSASSAGHDGVGGPVQNGDAKEPQPGPLPDSWQSDQQVSSADGVQGPNEKMGAKLVGRSQSSAMSLHQKRTNNAGRSKISLSSSVSQRKMLRRLFKHPNPIKIKTMFTKGVVDGMTEEDYKTCYFFNDLPRFIAPLNFHRGTYSWTHSSYKSEPSTPLHVSKSSISRSVPCSPVHFAYRPTIQSAPSMRMVWSKPSFELKQSSCLSTEELPESISKLSGSGTRVLNDAPTSFRDGYSCEKSCNFRGANSAYVEEKNKRMQKAASTTSDKRGHRCETIPYMYGQDLLYKAELESNMSDKSSGHNINVGSERVTHPPCNESCNVRHLKTKPAKDISLKTKSVEGLAQSVSSSQLQDIGVPGSSKSKDMLTNTCGELSDVKTSLAAFTAPHSQLLLRKKKLVKMHSFDHFDGNIDLSLSPKFCPSCQAQCAHCTHAPGAPSAPSRVPCCLRTCRYRSGSCGEVPRRCDNYGCESSISNDNFSDDKLVVSSARDFIVAPPLNEPPAQISVSSVSSSNEHPSRVSLLRHTQDENTILPPSFSESLSAQPPLPTDSGVPANYGLQTCLPSEQISRFRLAFDSASRNASQCSKLETRISNASIKESLVGESGPTQTGQAVHCSMSEKNLVESANFKANEQNGLALDSIITFEADNRELAGINITKKETKGRNHETSAEKRFSVLEQWMDSVFESDMDVIEASIATSKSGAVGKSISASATGDVAVKIAVSDGDKDPSGADQPSAKVTTAVEASTAQASPDDTEELSPVYEEANNLESSIAKLRSLLSERHPHQSGGSGSSVGSSDGDLPPDPLTEVSPSRHASGRSAVVERTSARFNDAAAFMSDRLRVTCDVTEPVASVDQLPCRPLEGIVEVLEGRDVPRDGRLIVNCSIPATVVESDPCGSPYTLYTVQYDALYVFDGRLSSKKRKMAKEEANSLKNGVPPSECSRMCAADSELTVKKSGATTSVGNTKGTDEKKKSLVCDFPIARGSSSSSDGKGENIGRDEGENCDSYKPRSKSATTKSIARTHRLVLHTKSVQRRFREFVSLHNALWVHPKLRFSLRGVTGPSKWRHLPHGKLDSATVSMRRLFLENYMQILLQRIDINTSSIMRQFLCYDSDSKPGEYRTPFEIDWSQMSESCTPRKGAAAIREVASEDKLSFKRQEELALPDPAAAEQVDAQPLATTCLEQRPTSLFCHDSSSSITSLPSFRDPPHVSSGTDDMDEMNLVNVLDIDNCELNIALTAELQPCAMEEALFEDFMVGDAGCSPDVQEASSDHHGASVPPGISPNMTDQPNLPVSSFLAPSLDGDSRKIYPEKSSLLVVSEPHCSGENTALIHAFHLSDLGNCVADSLSHALRLPLSYPDVGLLKRSVNTIKDCTLSTFSSSLPVASTSSTSSGEALAAEAVAAITEDKHDLSPQTSLLFTSKKLSSVNTETISLYDFPVDDSVPIVTHRRASVEGIGDADRKVLNCSSEIWSSCPNSSAVSSGLQLRNTDSDAIKRLKYKVPTENWNPPQKESTQGEVGEYRLCDPSCRTPEESLNQRAASCSPSSSTLVPESSFKRPTSTFLNILNGIQSVERPYGYAECIGVKYYCPNCSSRVSSCTRCEGSAVPGVTLPQQLASDLGDKFMFGSLGSETDVIQGKCSGNVIFNTLIALLSSQQVPNGKGSSFVLTEPIVELMVRWLVPSITAVIDDKLDQLFSEENVANFIHEILNSNNLESDPKATKCGGSDNAHFSPVLEYERFLAALGNASVEGSQLVDVGTLKELLISSLPDTVVELGLGEQLAESVLLLLQDPVFSAGLALETISLLCCHLLPQHQ